MSHSNKVEMELEKEFECPICMTTIHMSQPHIKTKCNHNFCYDCFISHQISRQPYSDRCPICRDSLLPNAMPSGNDTPGAEAHTTSTSTSMAMDGLYRETNPLLALLDLPINSSEEFLIPGRREIVHTWWDPGSARPDMERAPIPPPTTEAMNATAAHATAVSSPAEQSRAVPMAIPRAIPTPIQHQEHWDALLNVGRPADVMSAMADTQESLPYDSMFMIQPPTSRLYTEFVPASTTSTPTTESIVMPMDQSESFSITRRFALTNLEEQLDEWETQLSERILNNFRNRAQEAVDAGSGQASSVSQQHADQHAATGATGWTSSNPSQTSQQDQ